MLSDHVPPRKTTFSFVLKPILADKHASALAHRETFCEKNKIVPFERDSLNVKHTKLHANFSPFRRHEKPAAVGKLKEEVKLVKDETKQKHYIND